MCAFVPLRNWPLLSSCLKEQGTQRSKIAAVSPKLALAWHMTHQNMAIELLMTFCLFWPNIFCESSISAHDHEQIYYFHRRYLVRIDRKALPSKLSPESQPGCDDCSTVSNWIIRSYVYLHGYNLVWTAHRFMLYNTWVRKLRQHQHMRQRKGRKGQHFKHSTPWPQHQGIVWFLPHLYRVWCTSLSYRMWTFSDNPN